MTKPLILASASPRRLELLKQLGLSPLVLPSGCEEARQEGESPQVYVQRLALDKAVAVADSIHQGQSQLTPQWLTAQQEIYILAADTLVVLGDEVLEKPPTPQDAEQMLEKLSDNTHEVLTAVHLLGMKTEGRQKFTRQNSPKALQNHQAWCFSRGFLQVSRVTFAPLSRWQIVHYVQSGEPMDKAGAYGIQGKAGAFITHLSGSYTGVMGLPLYETHELCCAAGLLSRDSGGLL